MTDNQQNQTCPSTEASGWDFFSAHVGRKLASFEKKNRLRSLCPIDPAAETIDLTHNDYLGLRSRTDLREQILSDLSNTPFGSGGSRLLGGEWPEMRKLEQEFAQWTGWEDCLFFPSGYAANEAICRALAHPQAALFSDKLNHASIIDGIKLTTFKDEAKHIFRHNDLEHLEQLLKQSTARYNVVITESLFSMDGDEAPLAKLQRLCSRYRGILVVDEAHSIGVYGPHGSGLLNQRGVGKSATIAVYPCGKALGGQGAFIAGPSWLRNFLINTAKSFIYTTAASPWMVAALRRTIPYVADLQIEREQLAERSLALRQLLTAQGFQTIPGRSHIIPLLVGEESAALSLEKKLLQLGIKCRAIRPPTVPPKKCRLRISLNQGMSVAKFEKLKQAFRELGD